jgi:hypothetical protein
LSGLQSIADDCGDEIETFLAIAERQASMVAWAQILYSRRIGHGTSSVDYPNTVARTVESGCRAPRHPDRRRRPTVAIPAVSRRC